MKRFILLVVLLLVITPLFAQPLMEARTFAAISRPWIDKYGEPDWIGRTTYQGKGEVEEGSEGRYYDERMYAWFDHNIYVLFRKDRRYWKGWRLLMFDLLEKPLQKKKSCSPKDSMKPGINVKLQGL